MDDRELVIAARSGDTKACSRLFASHWGLLRAWLSGFTRDPAELEDLAQRAFLRAFEHLPRLRDPDRFLPWLRKVARSVALRRRRSPDLRALPRRVEAPSAAEEAARNEDGAILARAYSRLSRRERSLLALSYMEDLPVAAVARLLDTPVTTVRRRLAAAVRNLRRAFLREGGDIHGLP